MDRRPALIVPPEPRLMLACVPYARHTGALLLPDNPRSWDLVRRLEITEVTAVGDRHEVPFGGRVPWLPPDPAVIANLFAGPARHDHEDRLRALREAAASGTVDELLLRRMEPSAYVVVASESPPERSAAALAANYAGALGSPLLLIDDERVFGPDARPQGVLSGAIREKLARDARPPTASLGGPLGGVALPALEDALATIAPTYLSFVSNRMTIPLELTGEPPLATRSPVCRLTAPDPTPPSLAIHR